jgi:hypothetical protein
MNTTKQKQSPPAVTRAALDPTEFGKVFGKSKSWTYRMIYTGLRTIQGLGATLIPVSEIDRLLSSASDEYAIKPKSNIKKTTP